MKVNFDYIDFAEKIIEYKKQLRKKKKKVVSKGGVSIGEMGSNNTLYINPWEQAKIEVDRLSKEFMKELADAINKEVERQMKAKK